MHLTCSDLEDYLAPLGPGVDLGEDSPPTPEAPGSGLASASDDLLRPNHQGIDRERPDLDRSV